MADSSGLKAAISEMGYLPKCTVRERRSTMTDDEFWNDVYPQPDPFAEEIALDECFGIDSPNPCPECGAVGACGNDMQGRPWIHVVEGDE